MKFLDKVSNTQKKKTQTLLAAICCFKWVDGLEKNKFVDEILQKKSNREYKEMFVRDETVI